jgi:hypothetical protein
LYTIDKFLEAAQNTNNIWDFLNYPFYHFYGYSNLNKMWGGENIKALLYYGFGIDENGNMSIANFLLNLVAIIPIGRAGTIVGKFLAGVLEKAGIKIGINLADNFLIREIYRIGGNLIKKWNLGNFETWNKIASFVSNFPLPNPWTLITMPLEGIVKAIGNQKLITVVTAFTSFQFRRDLAELGSLLVGPDPIGKILETYGKLGGFINRNLEYVGNIAKKAINANVSTVKTVIGKVVNKVATTVKQVVNKVVDTAKKAVNKVVTKVKTTINKAVNTAKKAIKKAVTTVKKTVNKVVTTVKKAVNKVVNTVKKAVTSGVNWIKSKIRLPW